MLSKEKAKKILEITLATGADFGELFFEDTKNTSMHLENGLVSKVNSGNEFGCGIRILKKDKCVYGYTNDCSMASLIQLANTLKDSFEGQKEYEVQPLRHVKSDKKHQPKIPYDQVPLKEQLDLLKKGYQAAKDYNPKIAKVFKEIGLADELGSGVRNIVKYTKIYSGGEPTFEENDIFTTTIPLKKTINVSETNSIEISKGQNELLNDPLNDLLDDTQNKILNLIKHNNSLTYDEISNQLNISSSTVKRKIKEMKELDIIIRVNGKRDGYWKILK